jgi:hypothetical protein
LAFKKGLSKKKHAGSYSKTQVWVCGVQPFDSFRCKVFRNTLWWNQSPRKQVGCSQTTRCCMVSVYLFAWVSVVHCKCNGWADHSPRHCGNLLKDITSSTWRYVPLHQKFIQCLPSHFTTKDKIAFFQVYYLLILPSHGKMKSGDFLLRELADEIKNSRTTRGSKEW